MKTHLTITALILLLCPVSYSQVQFFDNNETMVTNSRTLVKTVMLQQGNGGGEGAKAICNDPGCEVQTEFLRPWDVVCPALAGKTCTLEVSIFAMATLTPFDDQHVGASAAGTYAEPYNANNYYGVVGNGNDTGNLSSITLSQSWLFPVKNQTDNQKHTVHVSLFCRDMRNDGCSFYVGGIVRYGWTAFEKINVYKP